MPAPLSTYRLQLHREFPFAAAAARADYLRRLGVDAAYLSPILTATPGSQHGYDVCDPTRLNPELGGVEGFAELSEALRREKLGCLVDFVPNHMAADARFNPWWRDVLEKGRQSAYASFFDIDWEPPKPGLRGKVLLPVLGDAYGRVLERGELRLARENDRLTLRYFDHDFPVNLDSEPELQGAVKDGGPALQGLLETFNGAPGEAASFDRLHALLEKQSYRLANWKTAGDEINYRRFFDVNELLGLRMELPEVHAAVHGFILDLVREGRVTGLRIDHIDGLRDPLAYLQELRKEVEDAAPGSAPFYLLVEKILCGEETLRPEWPVQGTTGYEFLNDLNGLFVDPAGLAKLHRLYRRFSGRAESVAQEERACKRLILTTTLASELNTLANRLDRLSEADRTTRDFTLESLRTALRETLAGLDIYRTYGRAEGFNDADREAIESALLEAMEENPALEPSIFDFLRIVLIPSGEGGESLPAKARLDLALKFQQLSGPVQAKSVEDTVFYRQAALISLNEVGGTPASTGLAAGDFHRRTAARAAVFPTNLLATETHDTKRGEDARARLNVLTEMPELWRRAVFALSRLSASWRQRASKPLPSRNDEYFLYQSLLGCWPVGADGEPLPADEAFIERVRAFVIKAAHEAKLHTSWIHPNTDYEELLLAFTEELLRGRFAARFREIFFPVVRACARAGAAHSLNQVSCKCAAPGVPDVYQGAESWDFSLVDPDNRRPVDFARLESDLEAMEAYLEPVPSPRQDWAASLWSRWPTGEVKHYALARCLRWRQAYPDLFVQGGYEPLEFAAPDGEYAGFARRHGDQVLLACLHTRALTRPAGELRLPVEWKGRAFTHLFTGEVFSAKGDAIPSIPLESLFKGFPTAWLWLNPA
jgi:(1->4)-alpha-D-glucan 1-alpha-D-glucosylmutase